MKKLLVLSILILSLLFTGCGVYDELKALSIYSDFLFSFQTYWEENSKDLTVVPVADGDIPGSSIYLISITEDNPIVGKLKNEYYGSISVIFFSHADKEGVDKNYFNFTTTLDVNSAATTIVGQCDHLNIDATAVERGLILDGHCSVSADIQDTIALYRQYANLEGLWIFLKSPAVAEK